MGLYDKPTAEYTLTASIALILLAFTCHVHPVACVLASIAAIAFAIRAIIHRRETRTTYEPAMYVARCNHTRHVHTTHSTLYERDTLVASCTPALAIFAELTDGASTRLYTHRCRYSIVEMEEHALERTFRHRNVYVYTVSPRDFTQQSLSGGNLSPFATCGRGLDAPMVAHYDDAYDFLMSHTCNPSVRIVFHTHTHELDGVFATADKHTRGLSGRPLLLRHEEVSGVEPGHRIRFAGTLAIVDRVDSAEDASYIKVAYTVLGE